ncbi:MAG TPA: hypothetical protein VFU31_10665 [Candidatus Binatia bacterium]|nr:hypothetical protein [Candidatus Binatia bacterium]
MAEDFDALWKRYWELVGDVVISKHQFFMSNLQRWLNLLEQDHRIVPILARLERDIDFGTWYQECLKTTSGMVGSGALTWPMDADKRLGMHLALIRAFASQKIPFQDFCHHFLWTRNDFNVMANDIAEQIFQPFSRDLQYEIDRKLRMASIATAPAAD